MLGKRSPQGDLFGADTQYLKFVGEDSFYGFLAREGRKLFRDEDFAALYCLANGRTSVPPSLLAMALLLQTHDRVSDEGAKARAAYRLPGPRVPGRSPDRLPRGRPVQAQARAAALGLWESALSRQLDPQIVVDQLAKDRDVEPASELLRDLPLADART